MRAAAVIALWLALAGCDVGGLGGDDDGGGVPPDGPCRELLDAAGVDFVEGPAMIGVADPITVTPPIAGVGYRGLDAAAPHASLFMDCALGGTLVRAAPLLIERGVTELVDLGIYNYRCIGGGTPPDCPNGVSEHAYGNAIDVAGYLDDDGTYYSVLDDFVIDGADEETCAAPAEPGADAFLHEILCAQVDAGLWGVALTPNYNADHRNHFHLDLSDQPEPFVH